MARRRTGSPFRDRQRQLAALAAAGNGHGRCAGGYPVCTVNAETPPTRPHRPAPGHLRRTSRTHWPARRVLLYVAAQIAVAAVALAGLIWLLARS